ncbi:predicted protein [Aspergillus terreus NIH2624]|uniref:Uncharacterized protein n=1 Tax=Aspergillus terreus (strain NIH 2624 / FGSC A1156) TaxID=341663 RepID=Q0C8X8_ASPTN|nr:uncharacterized protein ATEG_09856 [Aspergillus terreus NIH2624]EAU30047.1 predicted protein [Aspergillus terreus NIH2624]
MVSQNTGRPFKKFVKLMRQRARTGYLHWIYVPLNKNECIEAAWIRKLQDCSTIAFGPVLILRTSLRRTLTFGPQLPARIIDFYGYLPLVKDGDGTISGLFHDGLDSVSRYVSAFGVACNAQSQAGTLPLLPMDTHYEPPKVPPGKGSIACTWFMTKASLKNLVKVCWDLDLTQEVFDPVYIEKGTVDGRDYIKNIRGDTFDSRVST